MKKAGFISALLSAFIIVCSLSCHRQRGESPEKSIEQALLVQVDSFSRFIGKDLLPAVESGKTGEADLQGKFLKARLLYKRFEWAAEYFTGSTTRFVNGPPVREISTLGPLVKAFDPGGLQVMEELLYPHYDSTKKGAVIRQLRLLQSRCDAYKTYFTGIPLSDWQVFDAAKLEVFRILTLGITGFDAPLSLNSMAESAASLKSLRSVLACYVQGGTPSTPSKLLSRINRAVAYLQAHPDFNSFNRAVFITAYGNQMTTGISDLALQLKVPVIKYNRLLRQGARTLFDTDAFDLNAYAPGPEFFLSDQKIALGKRLFSDPMISGTGTRSCASCHQPGKAFTDGLKKNTVIGGHAPLKRNTPTLLNAALQPSLFYDLRVNTLEDQVHEVVQDKQEMDGSITAVAHRLWQNKDYRRLFGKAFPEKGRTGIDTFEVMNAIASYVRSLSRLNSRFDAYMRGDKTALDTEEVRGFNLFMGKAKCGTCHYMPLFNGTLPPKYFASDAEVIGVPASPADTAIDPDPGWFNIIGIASFKHAFKIPTVRNAARTAPYMHNGVFATLEDVMDFYNDGGGAGHGLRVANQTLSSDSLHLTQTEIKEVIAFIKSLNSR